MSCQQCDALTRELESAHRVLQDSGDLAQRLQADVAKLRERLAQYEPDGVELVPSREWYVDRCRELAAQVMKLREAVEEAVREMAYLYERDTESDGMLMVRGVTDSVAWRHLQTVLDETAPKDAA